MNDAGAALPALRVECARPISRPRKLSNLPGPTAATLLRARFRTLLRAIGGKVRSPNYRSRLAQELGRFRDEIDANVLPPIFHYWSNRYLRPKLESFGFSHPDAGFVKYAHECLTRAPAGPARIVSIGAGSCDTEVGIACALKEAGHREFVIECLDVNPDTLERGRKLADQRGVAAHIAPLQADFNDWRPSARYDAILANQSLHHVVELEKLFEAVAGALAPHGRFIVSDMIGRNGHQRWPEALVLVQEFWRELPERYRYNRQLRRMEHSFGDWDCSVSGFEGVRAQDILPLLIERFDFDVFIGFANIIDPFIDRGFGHNFDADAAWDRGFIDRVHERDEAEITSGRIKPTHIFAVLTTQPPGERHFHARMTPEQAIRRPD